MFETATLHRIERMYSSVSGNPRAKFHTSKGVFTSQSDAGFMYGFDDRDVLGKDVELSLTKAGRVWDVRVLTGKLRRDV